MVSFNDYEFQVTLSADVCYCITADQTLSLHFIGGGSVSVDFIFQIMLGSMESSQHFLFSNKSTRILINLINLINLLIYSKEVLYTPLTTDANPVAKFIFPDWGDKVDLAWRASTTTLFWYQVYPPVRDCESDGNGCFIASKLIKNPRNIRNIFIVIKLSLFLCIVYSMAPLPPVIVQIDRTSLGTPPYTRPGKESRPCRH